MWAALLNTFARLLLFSFCQEKPGFGGRAWNISREQMQGLIAWSLFVALLPLLGL